MKILLTGGTGFIGSALRFFLSGEGHAVKVLTRRPLSEGGEWAPWDPDNRTIDSPALEGHDAIIHLAGANIAEKRWTPARKEFLRRSRIASTEFLVRSLRDLSSPPRVFLGASAVGYYGFRSQGELVESSPVGRGFLAELCRDWEQAASLAEATGARVAHLRFGVVLDPAGGLLKKILPLFRLGLGGVLGRGTQFVSWIALEDLVRAVLFSLIHPLSGPINVTAPCPVTNQEFTKVLGRWVGKPAFLPVPAIVLKTFLGGLAEELLLGGQRVFPAKLMKNGFMFSRPTLEPALLDMKNLRTISAKWSK